jgi:hypothetical protein
MAPQNERVAPDVASGNGSECLCAESTLDTPPTQPTQSLIAILAIEKERLLHEIAIAQLTFLYADQDGVDIEALAYRVAAFKKVCRVLAWRAP